MSEYKFNPGDDVYEAQIKITFMSELSNSDMDNVISIVIEILNSEITNRLSVCVNGLSYLRINPNGLAIGIIFDILDRRTDIDQEDLTHRRVHFMLYLLAVVDAKQCIKEHPFPSDFRHWINIANEYGINDS